MKYDIYFHANCLDGAASAAILKYFLNLQGDDFDKYIPLQHPVDKKWWKNLNMKKPSAITDILYHPGAKIWFDHHPTTFIDEAWKENFKPDRWHILDTKSPSCTGLILRKLYKGKRNSIPARLQELVKWTDIIDRIDHKKIFLKDLIELKHPALQIGFYLDNENKLPTSRQKELVDTLSKKSLSASAKISWISKGFLKHKKKFDKSILKIKKMLVLYKNVAFIENLERKVIGVRFVPFYFYPKSNYGVRFVRHGSHFVLAAGVNPWHAPKKPAHIGKFLADNFGKVSAGGHAYAGSASFNDKKTALAALPKIIAYLNKHA